MAQQPKPLAKAPKSWWERYLQATGRSAIIQGQVAMAQADTLRNVSRKSADSLIQLAKGFYYAAEERNQKKFDSVGEFLNYVSLGIPKGMYLSYVERANKAFDSPNDTANWLTFGLHGTLREAMVPEDAWSPEHWSNIIGTVGFIEGTGSFFKPKPVLKNTVPKIKKAESSQALKPVKEVEGTGDGVQGKTERFPTKSIDPIADKHIIDKVSEARGGLSNRYKESGNFAYAEVNIKGVDKTDFYAHSGIHDVNKKIPGSEEFSFKPDEPIFKATEAPDKAGNTYLRDGDTEYKILNDLAKRLGDNQNATGKIKLFTEKDTCGSCNKIIQQFDKKYPNIKIEVVHNGDVPIPPKTSK
ncbi:deaminase domain-containing protein [Paenibacillus forsythiae]